MKSKILIFIKLSSSYLRSKAIPSQSLGGILGEASGQKVARGISAPPTPLSSVRSHTRGRAVAVFSARAISIISATIPSIVLAVPATYEPLAPLQDPNGQVISSTNLLSYLVTMYKVGIAAVFVIAFLVLIYSGMQYIMTEAVGNKKDANKRMKNAALGILLALSSYLILYTINPDLVNYKLKVTAPKGILATKISDSVLVNQQYTIETYSITAASCLTCLLKINPSATTITIYTNDQTGKRVINSNATPIPNPEVAVKLGGLTTFGLLNGITTWTLDHVNGVVNNLSNNTYRIYNFVQSGSLANGGAYVYFQNQDGSKMGDSAYVSMIFSGKTRFGYDQSGQKITVQIPSTGQTTTVAGWSATVSDITSRVGENAEQPNSNTDNSSTDGELGLP